MTATLAPGIDLRDYQSDDVASVILRREAGDLHVAGQAATGLGKTTYIAELVRLSLESGRRPLLLAHRDELIGQMADRVRQHVPGASVGTIAAGTYQVRRDVTLAMTPTLRGQVAQADLDRRFRVGLRRWHDVIYDECHHAASPSHVAMLDWLGVGPNERDEQRTLVGLTATLTRSDRKGAGLGDVFHPDPAFERGIPWAVDHGWLVRPFGKVIVAEHVDLASAKVSKGDYVDAELGEMIVRDVDKIVSDWREHASDRITVAFTPNVESAQALTDAFTAAGVAAECVIGSTSRPARKGMYARLAAGTTRVLVSVMVLTEGWDSPRVSCVLMARPTRLAGLYQQIVGRGLRLWPGKTDCMILDVVGASRGQKLASLVELYPGAEQDTSALDDLPCEDCRDVPCTCPPESGTKDPTGGRRRLDGPAVYETIDLLVADSRGAWLATEHGIPFLVSDIYGDRRAAVIVQERAGTYRVGTIAMHGRQNPHRLEGGTGCTLDQARRLAEDWAIARKPRLSKGSSVWRTNAQQPTWRQLNEANRLQIPHPHRYSGRELSEIIDRRIVSQRMDAWGLTR
jgi:superfamily II DNA or RNA helicase